MSERIQILNEVTRRLRQQPVLTNASNTAAEILRAASDPVLAAVNTTTPILTGGSGFVRFRAFTRDGNGQVLGGATVRIAIASTQCSGIATTNADPTEGTVIQTGSLRALGATSPTTAEAIVQSNATTGLIDVTFSGLAATAHLTAVEHLAWKVNGTVTST